MPQGFHQAKQGPKDGAAYVFIPEGEPCADAMRGLGLVAVATLGGCNGFNSDRDGGHFDSTRVVVVPEQDKCGVKYARKVAAAYPGCRWLQPYPGTAEWNGAMPDDGGLDVGAALRVCEGHEYESEAAFLRRGSGLEGPRRSPLAQPRPTQLAKARLRRVGEVPNEVTHLGAMYQLHGRSHAWARADMHSKARRICLQRERCALARIIAYLPISRVL